MFGSGVPILSLERYFKVLRNERRAKFLTCREFPADVNLNSDDKTLWQEHTRLMKAFNSSYASDDTEGTSFSSRHCHPSLLDLKVELSQRMLKSCNFCEHRCGVNRWEGELGHCRCGPFSPIASKFIHMYEEPELVPSFTIFFSGCNGGCIFCQNWDIANESDVGVIFKPQDLADIIMDHKSLDIRNVNWVGGDPTPHLHTVLKTLSFCKSNDSNSVLTSLTAFPNSGLLSGGISFILFKTAVKTPFLPIYSTLIFSSCLLSSTLLMPLCASVNICFNFASII